MARLTSTPVRTLLVVLAALPLGCGPGEPTGGPGPKTAAITSVPSTPTAAATPRGPDARERLQGTWEIVRYESESVIPDEAMPIMGALFNALRLEFSGTTGIARIEKSVEERVNFTIQQESGEEFTFIARGWMFDGARFRFTEDGQVEIKDSGQKWAGVSRLRRVP